MNTTKKGNEFEDRSYEIIKNTISSGQLGLIASQCKVFRKKGYYSHKRKGEIIFDLAIEVWPPSAERFTLLYIVECKSLSHKVPVDDIEEFHNKIDQISELNTKGVFITNKGYQKGAYNLGKSTGMMLIELDFDDTYKIVLHKIHRSRFENDLNKNWDSTIEALLTEAFNEHTRIIGLKTLSACQLEYRAKELLKEFKSEVINYFLPIPFDELIDYLANKYQLKTEFDISLKTNSKGQDILGYYSREENKIYVDQSISRTNRFPFVFSHELAHFFLHRELKMNQKVYDSFNDSEYNFRIGKYLLKNDKNWIEWQANQFAACLILPSSSLLGRVIWFQEKEGISHKGRIYVDHQRINQISWFATLFALLLIVGYPAQVYFGTRQNYKSNARISEKIIYEFDEDFIQLTGESFTTKLTWEKIYRATENKDWILIWPNRQLANVIHKTAFKQEGLKAFKEIVNHQKGIKNKLKP